MRDQPNTDANPPHVVLAGPDTLHISADMQLSNELHEKLDLYSHVLPDMQRNATRALDKLLGD